MKGPSLLEVCYRRGGFLKGARVGAYIVDWALCAQDLGREPRMEEFVEWSREPARTVFRHQAEFREVFPEWSTPQPYADEVERRLEAAGRSSGDPGALVALAQVPA